MFTAQIHCIIAQIQNANENTKHKFKNTQNTNIIHCKNDAQYHNFIYITLHNIDIHIDNIYVYFIHRTWSRYYAQKQIARCDVMWFFEILFKRVNVMCCLVM